MIAHYFDSLQKGKPSDFEDTEWSRKAEAIMAEFRKKMDPKVLSRRVVTSSTQSLLLRYFASN